MTVTVEDADGLTVSPVESTFGAFIVCSDAQAPALVRVLDAAGNELLVHTFSDPD